MIFKISCSCLLSCLQTQSDSHEKKCLNAATLAITPVSSNVTFENYHASKELKTCVLHTAELPLSNPDTHSEDKPETPYYLNLNNLLNY